MTLDLSDINALIQQVLDAKQGKAEPPTREQLREAYEALRTIRLSAGSAKQEKIVKKVLPDNIEDLFLT